MSEKSGGNTHHLLQMAMKKEMQNFEENYLWLEKSMPSVFFEDVTKENISLIVHALINFELQEYFCSISIKRTAIVMCLDSPDADIKILKDFANSSIQNYQCYISSAPPPIPGCKTNLRIAVIYFTEEIATNEKATYPPQVKEQLRTVVQKKDPTISD
ncbi:MAG: NAD-glutamate dehydrogenase domain-containing protein, partial [Parachlamydiaceae bacterium]